MAALCLLAATLGAQESTQNYRNKRNYLDSIRRNFIETTEYYDGLGRPYLNVSEALSRTLAAPDTTPVLLSLDGPQNSVFTYTAPNRMTLQEYDAWGRPSREYRSVTSPLDNYLSPDAFRTLAVSLHGDNRPYAETAYEASSLGRVTGVTGTGDAWTGHGTSTAYLTNTATGTLSCKLYTTDGENLSEAGYYDAGSLDVVQSTDEDGHITYTFADKQERTVLTRQMNGTEQLDTYRVYDIYGNLCLVLQPGYQGEADLAKHAFRYRYDSLNRCIRKQLPGAGPVTYVYDRAGHLTFSQDSVQRAAGKHTVYFYDQHNRLAMQGEVTQEELPDVSRMTVRCIRKNHASYYTNTSMQLGVLMYEFEGTDYYVNLNVLSDVPEVHPTFHLINYYDDYDFLETTALASFTFPEGNGYGQGRLTGTIVNTYDENGIITQGTSFEPIAPLALVPITSPRVDRSSNVVTVHYYDIKGREVQKVENNLKGGYETTTTGYTFTGQPGTVTHTHTDGTNSLTETYTYSYDGRDRVDSVKHTLNNGTEVSMTVNAYDNHGRLLTTTHNGKDSLKTTYAYNIRDWMTGLDNTLYNHTLTYSYGGNIATRQWTQDSKTRKYTYTYDGLDRLTGAAYTGDGNYATNYAYDKNGNIKTLQRYDVSLVDNLTLTYSGNQLTKVEDASNNTFGFANGASTTNEYTYDGNGNLTKDSNKGITNISYNSLSLPSVVTFGNGNTITYLYTADGRKLRTVHVTNGTATTTDYCGNVIYENGTRKLLLTEAGYVDLTDNSYHYYIKDHLGNNRIVADANGTVEESNQYYPFGLMYANANSNIQPYKYNGKELDTKNGLNWYDYGARHYDAALGRWHVVDPLSYNHNDISPYSYCLNNPLKFVDPDGKDAKIAIKGNTITITSNIVLTGPKATKELAQSYQKNIMDNWGQLNTYVHNEVIYDIVWDVNVRVAEEGEMLVHDGTNNFMEVTESVSKVGNTNEGEIRGIDWNGKSLDDTNPMAHEFGHMLGLKDKYQKIGKNDYVTRKGWKGNIMGELSGEGKVEMKNLDTILPNAIDYLNSINGLFDIVPWLNSNYLINKENREK